MRKTIYSKDEKKGKWVQKVFDTDKSVFICHSPQGDLYKKKTVNEYFTWKRGEDKPVIVSWAEANNLVRNYGTREQHLELFTLYKTSTNEHDGKYTSINLDSYHKVKAERNASRLGLNLTTYIKRLIDQDDANRNYQ